jgi:hypothetical protein
MFLCGQLMYFVWWPKYEHQGTQLLLNKQDVHTKHNKQILHLGWSSFCRNTKQQAVHKFNYTSLKSGHCKYHNIININRGNNLGYKHHNPDGCVMTFRTCWATSPSHWLLATKEEIQTVGVAFFCSCIHSLCTNLENKFMSRYRWKLWPKLADKITVSIIIRSVYLISKIQ